MAKALSLLIAFHFIFFWRTYLRPFEFSRSELLSTFFPSWIWQGRKIKSLKSWRYDPYFWLNFHSHPVLSSYYPIHALTAWVGAFLSLDNAFKLLLWTIRLHHLVTSLAWFLVFSHFYSNPIALFGSLLLTYNGFNIKQQPCLVYTITCTALLTLGIVSGNLILSSLSFGSLLLAGYYPLGIQASLWALSLTLITHNSLIWIPIGLLVGLIQLIPFLKYLPKTIRTKEVSDIGILKLQDFLELLVPNRSAKRGVGYQELSFYMGLGMIICLMFSESRAIWLALFAALIMIGFLREHLPRIPSRFGFLLTLSLGWAATNGLSHMIIAPNHLLALIFLTMYDLYHHNSKLDPHSPYSELPQLPSRAFNTELTNYLEATLGDARVSGLPYPLFTGHINKLRTLGYSGGMQLKLMAKFRQDTSSDGSGAHDWFKLRKDSEPLGNYRVKFAYTSQRLDWEPTRIPWLWKNPQF